MLSCFKIVQKTRLLVASLGQRKGKSKRKKSVSPNNNANAASINKVIYKFKLNKYSALDVYMKHFTLAHLVFKVFTALYFESSIKLRKERFRSTNTLALLTFSEMVGKLIANWRRNFVSCCASEERIVGAQRCRGGNGSVQKMPTRRNR